jgi:hypothetical protein
MVGKKTALASNEAVYSIGKEQREQTRKRRLAAWKVLESPSALLQESKEYELENRHSFRQVASILNHQYSYWPESLTVGEVAKLQCPHSSNEASKFLKQLIGDCGDEFLSNKHAPILTYKKGLHFVTFGGIEERIDWNVLGNCYRVIPSDLLAYLKKIDVKPTEHLLAWFAAAGIENLPSAITGRSTPAPLMASWSTLTPSQRVQRDELYLNTVENGLGKKATEKWLRRLPDGHFRVLENWWKESGFEPMSRTGVKDHLHNAIRARSPMF